MEFHCVYVFIENKNKYKRKLLSFKDIIMYVQLHSNWLIKVLCDLVPQSVNIDKMQAQRIVYWKS